MKLRNPAEAGSKKSESCPLGDKLIKVGSGNRGINLSGERNAGKAHGTRDPRKNISPHSNVSRQKGENMKDDRSLGGKQKKRRGNWGRGGLGSDYFAQKENLEGVKQRLS